VKFLNWRHARLFKAVTQGKEMSSHKTVLVATTEENVAVKLSSCIAQTCKDCGIRLLSGPSADKKVFDTKDELLSCLRKFGATQLAETLVLLHIGPDYEECFAAHLPSKNSHWHANGRASLGVALEIILRFPQLFLVVTGSGGSELQTLLQGLLKDANINSTVMLPNWYSVHFVNPLTEAHRLLQILARFDSGLRMIFDPTGLRTLLRNRFLGSVFGSGTDWANSAPARCRLARRLHTLAVVIDEELEMAMFAAYSAYKFGARAWMVTTYEALSDTANPSWHDSEAQGIVIIRDLDLRFPDYPETSPNTDKGTSLRIDLKNIYSDAWKGLVPPASTVRVISYDRHVVQKRPKWDAESLRWGQSRNGKTTTYYGLEKPLRSIYAAKSLLGRDAVLQELPVPRDMQRSDHHAAPYENLRISWDLQEQAEECRSDSDVKVCIMRALLAQEAYSLLLGMSPTSCLRAILEMTTAEAAAEGESAGVSHTLTVRDRRKDLEKTISNLNLKDGGANFLAKVWAQLRAVYKESEQFEASEEANAESLVYSKWTPVRLRIPGKVHFKGLRRLILKPLRSFYSLLGLLLIWTLLLTVMHAWAYDWTLSLDKPGLTGFVDLYRHVLNAIIRPEVMKVHDIDVALHERLLKAIVDTLMAGSSLIFVGLVVTVLFRKSTRG
jgi:hypothetical protein